MPGERQRTSFLKLRTMSTFTTCCAHLTCHFVRALLRWHETLVLRHPIHSLPLSSLSAHLESMLLLLTRSTADISSPLFMVRHFDFPG
jgi:hypothetical protein